MTSAIPLPGNEELRENHEFVSRYERLRKHFGLREMGDDALQFIESMTGVPVQTLRIFRHFRNALAHDDPVKRENLVKYLGKLRTVVDDLDGPLLYGYTVAWPEARPARPSAPASEHRRAFRLRARGDPDLERLALANGFVSVGGDEIGDVSDMSDEDIGRTLKVTKPNTASTIGRWVAYWRRFRDEVQVGDIVALSTEAGDFAVGEIVGDHRYVEHATPLARHRRAVDWVATGIARSDAREDFRKTLNARGTILEFKPVDAAQRLLALTCGSGDPR